MTPLVGRLLDALDERLGLRDELRRGANKVFPRHWSFLLGEVALVAFGILVVTGVFLAAFYRPTTEPVVYEGAATLFYGRALPAAFESVTRISHDVPGGLFIRRVHRVTATVSIIAIALHLLRVVLTGAFRKPREPNYHAGLVLGFLAVASGYSGHNLIWDVLAGTSLRILYTFLQSVPFVGEAFAQWAFGGEFPTGELLPRLYVMHVLVLPALIVVGIVLPLLIGALLFGYPAIERAVTGGDGRVHHAVQSPLEAPFRLGFVAGLVTFFLVLTTAAGHDVIARLLQTSVESVTWALRVLVLAGPVAVGVGFARYARWRGEAR